MLSAIKNYGLTVALCFVSAAGIPSGEEIMVLGEASGTHLSVDLYGGAFVDFRLSGQSPNPFSWKVAAEEMPPNNRNGAPFRGHFLCLGRWGAPTEGEMRAGVPHNGQPGNATWEVVTHDRDSFLHIRSEAPMDGITVNRRIRFAPASDHALFRVSDSVRSRLTVGRLFNVVQHATLGVPFLSTATIIDSNAGAGFMQHRYIPGRPVDEYAWPIAVMDSTERKIDLRQTTGSDNYVSTHVFPHDTAWATAAAPDHGLLIGYVWKTADYPFFNLWQDTQHGAPYAKGLEFGTTGIGRPYRELLEADSRFHGLLSFFYLDAGEEVEKSFIGFLVKIPPDYRGVQSVRISGRYIVLTEKGDGQRRVIRMENRYTL
ncbi:MAG: hypothetical protein LBC40_09810 [Dysgonamonadaceae bacterium]|jgi:hypothetical protein|nr:hypothetical protein [Dysgonamonadaceae bacterium]